ncbi:MAG TPA: hypothetical protein PL182_07400 [Pseudobdellovibrionaceae bacterium]|nr:hypothetical protein [Pseudobdellovibrionaceae bacterium]
MTTPQYNLNYKYGADLREIPEDAASMQAYVDFLLTELKKLTAEQPRLSVKFLGEIGSYARMLGKTEAAHQALDKSLSLIDQHEMGLPLWGVHSLRYGEVMRAKKDDLAAETAFHSVLEMSRRHPEICELEDFALQHLGKLRFSQKKFKEAETFFREALELRKKKAVPELIQSTELALRVLLMTKDRLK